MGDGKDDPPKAPQPSKDYPKWIEAYLSKLPAMLEAEADSRAFYDPERVEQDLLLEDAYGGIQREQTLAALNQLDPNAAPIRGAMATNILKGLQDPYGIPDDLRIASENDIRGAQTARGNFMGAGAASAEALYKGQVRQNMAQRNLENAGRYLGTPSPITQAGMVQPVTPDRSAAYTIGGMATGMQGAQLSQNAYQNQLAAYNAQGPSPWVTAATGAAQGYAQGGWTGALIGGAAGYYAGS